MMKLLSTHDSNTGTDPIMGTGVGEIMSLQVTTEKTMNSLTKQLHTALEQLNAACSPVWFTIVRNYDRNRTAFSGVGPN
jgi:hypothetical protein